MQTNQMVTLLSFGWRY